MTALCSSSASCVRSASPHGRSLLVGISRYDVPPHVVSRLCQEGKTAAEKAARLSTSCHCLGAQSTSPAYKTTAHRTRAGDVSGTQQQGSNKVFQQVNVSNWVVGGVSSVINGLGSFAATLPRLTEEITRMVKKNGDEPEPHKEVSKMQVVMPLSEEPEGKDLPKKRSTQSHATNSGVKKTQPPLSPSQEPKSFAEAMEDTYSSVTSYYGTPGSVGSGQHNKLQISETTLSPADVRDAEDFGGVALKPKLPVGEKSSRSKSWNMFHFLPMVLPFPFNLGAAAAVKKPLIKKDFVSRSALDSRTRSLVKSLKAATTPQSTMKRLQELCSHIKQHPLSRVLATKEKAIPILLRIAENKKDKLMAEEACEALALLGYVHPLSGRGIRILTLDGGGTRGLVSIECLKKLEALTGKQTYEMFDYVCGVSTGALIAGMTCLFRYPLEEVERLYIEFSREMFTRSRVMGTSALVWNHAFYDSEQWEKILQAQLGFKPLIEFSRDPRCPKLCAVSSLVNTPHMKNFLFRNYNLPPESYSKYPGSCTNQIWEVIRASTAAPGYYEDFILNDLVHMDGGVLVNNPTALAIHESRLLWPNESLQCVVSLGTGRYAPTQDVSAARGLSLREKVSKIVDSATDTEGVHNIMTDLMPPATYFRFNPYLSEDLQLDEIRQDKLEVMARDTQMYLRKNGNKLNKAAEILRRSRLPHQHALDWLRVKADKFS